MKLLDFNKKSQSAVNIFLPIISLFFFGVVLIFSGFFAYSIASTILSTFPTVSGLATAINGVLAIYSFLDYAVLILSVFFIILIGYTSYRLKSYPMYYLLTFFTSAFYGFIAYVLSYIFSQYASNAIFVTILYMFPLTILLLTNLHWIALAMIIVGAITFYSGDQQNEIPLR